MAWLPRWKRKGLALTWTYSAKGQIWRLLRSRGNHLFLEERDIDSKTVVFTLLHAKTGEVQWSKNPFSEQWWISVEAIHQDVLFLHEYATPDMPDHKNVIAVDLNNGTQLWSNPEMKYLFSHGESVFATRDSYDKRQCFELGLYTGAPLREVDDTELDGLRARSIVEVNTDAQFPSVISKAENEELPLPEHVRKFLSERDDIELVECIDRSPNWILAYYQRHTPVSGERWLSHALAVLAAGASPVLFEAELEKNMRMAVPDLFFCDDNMLFFISEKRSLCAVNLSSE